MRDREMRQTREVRDMRVRERFCDVEQCFEMFHTF